MWLNAVKSSNIKAIGWEDNVLVIEFNNSTKYSYDDVSKEEYDNFINADSIGSYYHKNIKGKYTSNKL